MPVKVRAVAVHFNSLILSFIKYLKILRVNKNLYLTIYNYLCLISKTIINETYKRRSIMKIKYILLAVVIIPLISQLDARGKGRKHHPKFRPSTVVGIRYVNYPNYGYNYWGYNNLRYNSLAFDPFWDSSFRSSMERDFVLADVDQIFKQVVKLKEMKEKGIITAKEYDKVKKRLIDRVGKLIPSKKLKNSSDAIIQLEKMHKMKETEILTSDEFEKKKKRMLLLI